MAASNGNLECMKLLVEKGADVNMKDGEGSFPLHEAASNGKYFREFSMNFPQFSMNFIGIFLKIL